MNEIAVGMPELDGEVELSGKGLHIRWGTYHLIVAFGKDDPNN